MYCNLHGSYSCVCMQHMAAQQQSGMNSIYDQYLRDAMRAQQHQQLRHDLMYGSQAQEPEGKQQTRAYVRPTNKKLLLLGR